MTHAVRAFRVRVGSPQFRVQLPGKFRCVVHTVRRFKVAIGVLTPGGFDEETVYTGDTVPFEWQLTDKDGHPFDPEGWTPHFTAKAGLDDDDTVFDVTGEFVNVGGDTVVRATVSLENVEDTILIAELALVNTDPDLGKITAHQVRLLVKRSVRP